MMELYVQQIEEEIEEEAFGSVECRDCDREFWRNPDQETCPYCGSKEGIFARDW